MINNYLMAHDYAAIVTFSLVVVVGLIVSVFFSWSMYKALKLVPVEHYIFPRWFVWLMIIPVVGLFFQWMMLPFGIPQAFEKTVAGNEAGVRDAKKLFALGLAFVILVTLGIIPFFGFLTGIAGLIIWIIYWYQVVQFRQTYLDHRTQSKVTAQ